MHASERLHLAFPNISTITPALSLFATIAASEQMLDQETREALRVLAQHMYPQTSFSEEELVQMTGITIQALDQLSDIGLLESTSSGCYRLHPVIADYVRVAS